MSGSPPGLCARCGATNPAWRATCEYCGSALPTAPAPPVPLPELEEMAADEDRLVPRRTRPRSPATLVLGVFLAVVGLAALAIAAVVSEQVASFNAACEQNPLCTPQSDPSGPIAAAGGFLLLVGVFVAIYGVVRYRGGTTT